MKFYVDPNVFFNTRPPAPEAPKKKERDEFKAYLRVKRVMDKMEEERKKAEAEKKKKDEEKEKDAKKLVNMVNPWALGAALFFFAPTITGIQLLLIAKLFKSLAN